MEIIALRDRPGLAGQLLAFIRADMAAFGVAPLYLITDHTSFYERYGWQFVCMAGTEEGPIRLYMHPCPLLPGFCPGIFVFLS